MLPWFTRVRVAFLQAFLSIKQSINQSYYTTHGLPPGKLSPQHRFSLEKVKLEVMVIFMFWSEKLKRCLERGSIYQKLWNFYEQLLENHTSQSLLITEYVYYNIHIRIFHEYFSISLLCKSINSIFQSSNFNGLKA